MTANEELKTVVRNWIAKRIQSTNDDYLASNDYVKFDRIEEESATSGVYSTILKDTDASGQIEFVDTPDDAEYVEVLKPYIVYLDDDNNIVPLHPDISGLEGWQTHIFLSDTFTEENAAEFVRQIGTTNPRSELVTQIQSMISAADDTTLADDIARELNIVNYEKRTGKYIVLLDSDGRVVPYISNSGGRCFYIYEWQWTAEEEQSQKGFVERLLSGELNGNIEARANMFPDWAERTLREKTIVKYEVRGATYGIVPDKNMKVVGLNMFNDAVATLETRITELETRLTDLISAFEDDDVLNDETLQDWIDLLSTPDVVIPEETMEQMEAADAAIKDNYNDASELELHFLDCLEGWKISQPAENESYDDKVWRWANMIQRGTGIVWNTADKADADQTYATLKDKDREELSNGEAEFVNSYRMEWDS